MFLINHSLKYVPPKSRENIQIGVGDNGEEVKILKFMSTDRKYTDKGKLKPKEWTLDRFIEKVNNG